MRSSFDVELDSVTFVELVCFMCLHAGTLNQKWSLKLNDWRHVFNCFSLIKLHHFFSKNCCIDIIDAYLFCFIALQGVHMLRIYYNVLTLTKIQIYIFKSMLTGKSLTFRIKKGYIITTMFIVVRN
jgi:hypothetical protein